MTKDFVFDKKKAGQLAQARRLLTDLDKHLLDVSGSDAFPVANGDTVQALRDALLRARTVAQTIARLCGERDLTLPPDLDPIDKYRKVG